MFLTIFFSFFIFKSIRSDLELNAQLELNNSQISYGNTNVNSVPHQSPAGSCSNPDMVYQAAGPINIYLKGGLTKKETSGDPCKCPRGPPGPKGGRGMPGKQGPQGPPGRPGERENATTSDIPFVAFSLVMEARPFGPYSYYKIVEFDNILTNVGGGYNDNKGTFTAPLTGYYQFHINIHTTMGNQAEVRVMLNSERIVSVWADGKVGKSSEKASAPIVPFMSGGTKKSTSSEVHEMGSTNSFIIKMIKGQKLYCILPSHQVLAGLGFSSFSGHLLKVIDN